MRDKATFAEEAIVRLGLEPERRPTQREKQGCFKSAFEGERTYTDSPQSRQVIGVTGTQSLRGKIGT